MKSNIIEAIIGAIVLIIAGIFLMFAYTASQKNITDGYSLYAKFINVGGVSVGSDVKIAGVKVGTIKSLTIDGDTYQAKVEFVIKDDFKLPEDSSVSIVSEGFIGGKYIDIQPGGSEEMLEPGDDFLYTQSSISFESLLGKFIFNSSKEKESSKKES